MFAFLQRLVAPMLGASEARSSVTPGRLYVKMSAEFEAFKTQSRCGCVMPLPYTCEPAVPGDCNWRVQQMWSQCNSCEPFLRDLVERYSRRYDIRDPLGIETGSFVKPAKVGEPCP